MAFTLVQAGASLYAVNTDGAVSSALTLPTNITLAANRIPRFARFQNYVVVVNTPSRPISVGVDGTVRVLTPLPPATAATLSGANGGALSGRFQEKQTFLLLDSENNLISESDYGPTASAVTIASKYLQAAGVNLSGETVSASRLYRTTDNGAVFFQWIDVDGNVTTTISDDRSDASLGLIAGPILGSAPDLVLIKEWGGRLWGVGRGDGDNLRWTQAGTMYGWSAFNTLPIPHVGDDRFGVTALAPRKDFLGVGRRNSLIQIPSDPNGNFRPITVAEECGILSQESTVTYGDAVFFLWYDGVYRWDASGLTNMSTAGNVHSWFATDDYFNRGMFSQSFAVLDRSNTTYNLFLCAPGSTTPNYYIEMDLESGKFFGPHRIDAFTPSCALVVRGTNDQPFNMVGSVEGYLSQDVETRADWKLTPIVTKAVSKRFTGPDPDRNTYFGELSLLTEASLATTATATITASVGELRDHTLSTPMPLDLTQSRQRLFRVGQGKTAQLQFETTGLGDHLIVHGYTIPIADVGRR